MSERLQIHKFNNSTTCPLISNQSKLLDKNRKPLMLHPPLVQAKLTINQPGDEYEQEANRIAEQIMRMPDPVLQRRCVKCDEDEKNVLQAKESPGQIPLTQDRDVPPIVHEVLRSPGQKLDSATRAYMETRFGHDLSKVRVHTDEKAAKSAKAVNALAYTVGQEVVFGAKQYAPKTTNGAELLAHELTHVIQQRSFHPAVDQINHAKDPFPEEHGAEKTANASLDVHSTESITRSVAMLQRRAAPYIKKITVHLNPPQSANLEWEGTAPGDAPGSDNFTVSTGKGYSDPDDPRGTCTRTCCKDAMTQCAPPWNQPDRVGACCTYYGNNFWTGTPLEEHNTWKWWTPIQPYYSSRGIALHQHNEVTGQPIGHGCVRMKEPNAKRIFDFSNGRRTNVTIEGRAAPVACDPKRRCSPPADAGSERGELESPEDQQTAMEVQEAVPRLEGEMT